MDNTNSIFDDNLFAILKECKTLPNFLDTIFGFLKRRTDFYCIATEPKSPTGLPQGWAEHFVKEAFFKWKPNQDCNVIKTISQTVGEVVVEDENVSHEVIIDSVSSPVGCNESEIITEYSDDNFTMAESYNGSAFENYTWSQTITDLDIIIKLPENVTTKNVSVNISPQKINAKLNNSNEILLEGDLCHKVKHNDAIWSLDKRKLEIHLDKLSEMWWDCLVQSEPKLDVTKIDCSRPFEELSEEAQAKIEELTWNQERKRLGLPTSDQLLLQHKFKNAWDAEGSPFKGSVDPNTVIIQQ